MFHFVPQAYPVYSAPISHGYPRYEPNPYSAYSPAPYSHYDVESDEDDYDLMYTSPQPYSSAPRRSMLVDPFSLAAAETQQRRQEAQRAAAYRHQQEQIRRQQQQEAYENQIRREIAQREALRRQAEAEMYERELRRRQELIREREKQRELQRQRKIQQEQELRQQERNPLLDFINLLNGNSETRQSPASKTRSIPVQQPTKTGLTAEQEEPKNSDLNNLIQAMFGGVSPANNSTQTEKAMENKSDEAQPEIETSEREMREEKNQSTEIAPNEKELAESIEVEDPAEPILEAEEATAETNNEEINSLHAHYTTHLNRRTALQTLASIDANFESNKQNFTLPENLTFQPSPPPSDLNQAEHHKPPTPKLAFSSNNHDFLAYEHGLLEMLTSIDGVQSGGDLTIRKARKNLVKKIEKELENLDKAREAAWHKSLEKGEVTLDNLKDISIKGDEAEPEKEKTSTDSQQIEAELDEQHDSDTDSTLSVESTPQKDDEMNVEANEASDLGGSKQAEKIEPIESVEPNQANQTVEISA